MIARSSGRFASSVKRICAYDASKKSRVPCVWRKRDALVDVAVLAVFMVCGARLPGARAFRKSRALARHVTRSCESFINLGLVIETSELRSLARVVRVIDTSTAFTAKRQEHEEHTGDHSLLVRAEVQKLVGDLPSGAVGVWANDTTISVFIKTESKYDSIVAHIDGSWSIHTRCEESFVNTTKSERGELLIFESV